MNNFSIRTWSVTDSVEEITELFHLAYGALARQGMHYNASHQPPSQTLDRLTSGDSFVAIEQESGKILGTITLYQSKPSNHHPYYRRPGLAYFGQFGVHPDYQGNGDHARAAGATEIALDTAETAHDLISMYGRRGFSIVDTADWESTNYISVIMAKRLG